MQESTNKVDKNAIAVFFTNSHFKENLVGPLEQNDNMIVSISLFRFHYALNTFATGKRINHRGGYGLEIPANFHFYGPEKTLKLTEI